MRKKYNLCFIIILTMLVQSMFTSCTINQNRGSEDTMNNLIHLTPLTIEEGQDIYPKSYDDLQYSDNDLLLQCAYLSILNEYLEREVKLSKYQEKIDSSEFYFPYTNKTIYSKVGIFDRMNISLRNTPFVNRLSIAEKNLILSSINSDNEIEITDELLSLVKKTWKDVITVKLENENEEAYEIVYDMDAIKIRNAMSDALTFEICYETEYDDNGNIPNDDYEIQKQNYVFELKKQMEVEIGEKLDCHVTVFIKRRG